MGAYTLPWRRAFEKVKINSVLIGGFNDDEISDLAELTRRYPVDLRFIRDDAYV